MNHGLFTGVGVGPGDPELLTLKAVKAISDADIIIAPRTEKRDDSIALAIAQPYIKPEAQIMELVFPMVYDEQQLDDSWKASRDTIADLLRQGRHIIFLTLGDPMLYSTYIYVYRLLKEDGFETATVPGVTSFAAICSRIGMPLAEGDDILSIVPATVSPQRLEQAMAAADRVVLMKVSRNFGQTCDQLQRNDLLAGAVMVSKCGQPEEEIEWDLASRAAGKVPYLSTIITGRTGVTEPRKAIVAVSFGTTFPATRDANIGAVENALREAFPGWPLYRAFTSPTVVRRIEAAEGVKVDFLRDALERAQKDGVRRVVVQSLHIIPGEEYDKVVAEVERFRSAGVFDEILLGRPLLYTDGNQPGCPDDYAAVVEALAQSVGSFAPGEAMAMMGHGSGHFADSAYQMLQDRLAAAHLPIFIGTVEGSLTLQDVLVKLQSAAIKKVRLMPFMLVAGDHAVNDMAGDDEDSWRSALHAAGLETCVQMQGLGEFAAFRNLFVAHARDAGAGLPCARLFEEGAL